MQTTACPPDETLRDYTLGKLPESEAQAIGAHLRHCTDCLDHLDKLNDLTDPLIAGLRSSPMPECHDDSLLRMAIDRVLSPGSAPGPKTLAGLQPGMMLREYRIIEKIGGGGMGVVYRALHTRIDKEVALKVIVPDYVAHSEAVARFNREMKAAGKFQHPNIVQATDAGEVNGLHFLVMEFVPGTDLSTYVRQHGRMRIAEACDVIEQAANGLQHAHEHGMVHRDIKPSNLLMTPQGTVKILDLGLALLRDDPVAETPRVVERPARHDVPTAMGGNALTTTSHMLGTNDYMAPEQFQNAHAVDARADVFSLGCTLIFLLTGKHPVRTINGGFESIRRFCPEMPKELETVLGRMLALEPSQRYQSAREVADAVARFAPPKSKPARDRRPMLIMGGIAAAAIIGVAIWLAIRTPGTAPAKQPTHSPAIVEQPKAEPELLPTPREFTPRPAFGQLGISTEASQSLQKEWAEYAKLNAKTSNSIGMKLALIPPGEFFINVENKAQVRITRPYYMGVHEVTRKQFAAYIEATKKKTYHEQIGVGSWDTIRVQGNSTSSTFIRKDGLTWREPGYAGAGDDDPVVHIHWQEAVFFCDWLSKLEKQKYRLPTDAEWEWAARAGVGESFPNEPDRRELHAWYYPHAGDRPHPVGLLQANAWGLTDCLGNVREWCSDWYGADTAGLTEDPKGPKANPNQLRVVRGGDYRSVAPNLSMREASLHYLGRSSIGFRVVREIELK